MALQARLEDAVQREVIRYIEAVCPRALVFAVPNAARRTAGGRPMNAVPGLLRGASDLIAVFPGGRVVFIECKTAQGRADDHQIAFAGRLQAIGGEYFIARSQDDVRRGLAAIGIATMESRS